MVNSSKYYFFAGGYDLEMLTIIALLVAHDISFMDFHLKWGGVSSDYEPHITNVVAQGYTPVLLELNDDCGAVERGAIIIDHHGKNSGDLPSSLRQVFELLQLPEDLWTREYELIDANDRGAFNLMLQLGASESEIIEIRKRDRAAQGITAEQERAGEKAIQKIECIADGLIRLVRLPHAKCAVVTDRLAEACGGVGYRNLLILSPAEANFYGDGRIVYLLELIYTDNSNTWSGGNLPSSGFWGARGIDHDALIAKLVQKVSEQGI